MQAFMQNNKKSTLDKLTETGKLDDDLTNDVREALAEFNRQYGVDKPHEATVTV
jgi:hypothetical protein